MKPLVIYCFLFFLAGSALGQGQLFNMESKREKTSKKVFMDSRRLKGQNRKLFSRDFTVTAFSNHEYLSVLQRKERRNQAETKRSASYNPYRKGSLPEKKMEQVLTQDNYQGGEDLIKPKKNNR